MDWGWIVGAFVVFLVSAVYQRLYKQQDDYAAHLSSRIQRQSVTLVAARQLEETALEAVTVMGQAMVKLSSDEALSLEIEEHYNALKFRANGFREEMLRLRKKHKEVSDG